MYRLDVFFFCLSFKIPVMKETMINTTVTYTLKHGDRLYVVENVPARVCRETGEEYFSPDTVEHIQELVKNRKCPDRVLETPVFEYQ